MLGHSPIGSSPLGSSARPSVVGVVLSAISSAQTAALKQVGKLFEAVSTVISALSAIVNQIIVLGVKINILDDPRFIRVKSRRSR